MNLNIENYDEFMEKCFRDAELPPIRIFPWWLMDGLKSIYRGEPASRKAITAYFGIEEGIMEKHFGIDKKEFFERIRNAAYVSLEMKCAMQIIYPEAFAKKEEE